MRFPGYLPFAVLAFWSCVSAGAQRWSESGRGVVTDDATGLQWTQRDNGSNMNWAEAKRYCDSLALAGGHWRLPGIEELAALYTDGRGGTTSCGSRNGKRFTCKASPLFGLTLPRFWSATTAPDSQDGIAQYWAVDMRDGVQLSGSIYIGDGRAVCVRRP